MPSPPSRASLEDAIVVAAKAHHGQRDRAGEPYILHVLRVMMRQQDADARIIGVLHDVLEDTRVTLEDLRKAGFSEEICTAVNCLTRRADESYEDYIARIAAHPLARRVKLADLEDNMDERRNTGGADDLRRLARYKAAWQKLDALESAPE